MSDIEELQHEALQEGRSGVHDLPSDQSLELMTLERFKDEKLENYIQNALRQSRTDPALLAISKAIQIRSDRERLFSRTKPDDLDNYLLSLKEEILDWLRVMQLGVLQVGKLLLDAKQLLHGRFSWWVKENLGFSQKTAQNYLNAYERTLGNQEVIPFIPKSALFVICRISYPAQLREYVFNRAAEGVYEAGAQEFLEAGMKYADGKITLDSPEVQQLVRRRTQTQLTDRIVIILNKINPTLNTCRKILEEMQKEQASEPLLLEEIKRNPVELRSAVRLLDEIKGMVAARIKQLGERGTSELLEEPLEAEARDIAEDEVIEADSSGEYLDEALAKQLELSHAEDKTSEVDIQVNHSREPSDEQLAKLLEAEVGDIEESTNAVSIEAKSNEEPEAIAEPKSKGMEEEAAGAYMEAQPDQDYPDQELAEPIGPVLVNVEEEIDGENMESDQGPSEAAIQAPEELAETVEPGDLGETTNAVNVEAESIEEPADAVEVESEELAKPKSVGPGDEADGNDMGTEPDQDYPNQELSEPDEPGDIGETSGPMNIEPESIKEPSVDFTGESEEILEPNSLGLKQAMSSDNDVGESENGNTAETPVHGKARRKSRNKGRGRSKPRPAEHTKFEETEEKEAAAEPHGKSPDAAVKDSGIQTEPAEAETEDVEEAAEGKDREAKSDDDGAADTQESPTEEKA